MIVDAEWVRRNLGFNPISTAAPATTFAFDAAAKNRTVEDYQREIIDFDSEAPEGREFMAFTTATGLSRFTDIPWPNGFAPKTGPAPRGGKASALPRADILLVTWTVDEGHALSRVFTPGKDSRNDYAPYAKNFASISARMRRGCPALQAGRLGTYWTSSVGTKKIVVFKSDSHMSQDGPELPNIDVWRQIIDDVRPKLVITTGTAGGIGKQFEVGDVIVSPIVRFDCKSKFKNFKYKGTRIATQSYATSTLTSKYLGTTKKLFAVNSGQLPKENTRAPKIFRTPAKALAESVVTTDFFGFDTSNDHYKLQGWGRVSEMGDAVLGLVAKDMGSSAPRWVAVRNVSDPQIKAAGLSLKEQANLAAQIYKGFGRWSSVCSAITCWALIAGT